VNTQVLSVVPFIVSLLSASSRAQSQVFPGRQFPSSPVNVAAEASDFNGDGKPDAIITLGNTTNHRFFPGDGMGGFGSSTFIGGAGDSPDIAAADFNSDGKADYVSSDRSTDRVKLLLGLGNGSFSISASVVVGNNPDRLVVGDLNQDGRLDAAVARWAPFGIDILAGDGAGGLSLSTTLLAPILSGLAIGDVDLDGRSDLASATGNNSQIAIFYSTGGGSFASPQFIPVGNIAVDVELADLDANGMVDIVCIDNTYINVSVLLASAPGTFLPPTDYLIGPPLGNGGIYLFARDLTGDGLPDVCAWSPNALVATFLYNLGGGVLGHAFSFPGGGETNEIIAADWNVDGAMDLLFANDLPSITVFVASSPGIFDTPHATPTLFGQFHLASLALTDFDGDGFADAAGVESSNPDIMIFPGDGAGGFLVPVATLPTGNEPEDVEIADLNLDGLLDLVACDAGPDTVKSWLGAGGFVFNYVGSFPVASSTFAASPRQVVLGDLNLDGKLDAVTCNESTNNISILVGFGNGTFSTPIVQSSGGAGPAGLALADFNENGLLDVVVGNSGSGKAAVMLGNGHNFGLPQLLTVGTGPRAVAATDFTGDGHADFAAGCKDSKVYICYGNGAGGFPLTRSFNSNFSPHSLATGDANGDGRVDGVSGNEVAGFTLLLQNGAGLFQSTSHPLADLPTGVVLHDLDADGRFEVVGSGGLSVSRPLQPAFAGLSAFGSGTSGCSGRLGMYASGSPSIGNNNYFLLATNAPGSTLGLGLIADAALPSGADSLGVGVIVYIDFFAATQFMALDMPSNGHGDAYSPAPIPNDPQLVGQVFVAQSLFIESPFATCTPGLFGLESSRALLLSILP
jgi:hypothetical protein